MVYVFEPRDNKDSFQTSFGCLPTFPLLAFLSTLAFVLLNVGEFTPMVHPELTNKNPRASRYQSSSKVEEVITRDVEIITYIIRSCDKDEG
jgi:hypothetical protein